MNKNYELWIMYPERPDLPWRYVSSSMTSNIYDAEIEFERMGYFNNLMEGERHIILIT